LIESMPAQAWFALAVPDVGQALGKVATALKANPLIASQYGRVAQAFRARTGLDLDKDLLTLGDVGLFARGTTPPTVRGTLVTEARRATLRRARALAATHAKDKLAVMAPRSAAEPLGETPLFKKAAATIGSRPTLFVNFGPALSLAAKSSHHRSDAHFQRAFPRLRNIEYIAAGARRDGGLDVARGVIGLR
jgi:hypothetical protein